MQRLLFLGLLGSLSPEATPKLYPLHPKLRMKAPRFLPFWDFFYRLEGFASDIKIAVLKLVAPQLPKIRSCKYQKKKEELVIRYLGIPKAWVPKLA
jgi:hypothetical protein